MPFQVANEKERIYFVDFVDFAVPFFSQKEGERGGGLKSVKDKRFFFAGREENMIKKGHDIFLNTKEKLKVRIHFHSPFLPNCMVAPNDGQCYWGKLTVTHELTV